MIVRKKKRERQNNGKQPQMEIESEWVDRKKKDPERWKVVMQREEAKEDVVRARDK